MYKIVLFFTRRRAKCVRPLARPLLSWPKKKKKAFARRQKPAIVESRQRKVGPARFQIRCLERLFVFHQSALSRLQYVCIVLARDERVPWEGPRALKSPVARFTTIDRQKIGCKVVEEKTPESASLRLFNKSRAKSPAEEDAALPPHHPTPQVLHPLRSLSQKLLSTISMVVVVVVVVLALSLLVAEEVAPPGLGVVDGPGCAAGALELQLLHPESWATS